MTRRTAWKSGTPEAALLSGATVVDPRAGLHGELDVHISDGKIVSVSEAGTAEVQADCQVIDCSGQILMPAFTDPHVHFRTPGQEHKETISSGTAAAAAGGYCLVLAMPNTTPTVDGAEILRGILARAEQEALIPMGQLGAITKGLGGLELTEMAQMTEAGAAGFTDDGIPVTDAGVLRKALRYQQVTGAVIALHEEDPSLSLGAPLNEGLVSAKLGLRGQPGVAESTMISRDCELAELENAVIHVQHVSSGGSVRVIREAKARGVKVTAEASPHHLLLTDEACSTLDS
ncbi:MAG: amidohydrolase family protein, partial [Solirubrobacterales bacterium]|nr:amidohydrolase family protein [Solirubrobacterales bacterium]